MRSSSVLLLPLCAALSSCVQNAAPPSVPAPATASSSFPGAGRDLTRPMPNAQISCFYGGTKTSPAATILHQLEVLQGVNVVHLRLTLDPDFVDNTYGANSINWGASKRGTHTWKDLVGSDHAELLVIDGAGATALDFKLDYISADPSVPSGYRSLGVSGGDGKMILGDPAALMQWSTSMDLNFNQRGYGAFTVDSPPTDAKYTPGAATPNWDYRVVYEAWVRLDKLGPAGFGAARLTFIHASPSKAPTNTVNVIPRECPDDWFDEICGSGGCTVPKDPVPLEGGGGACASGASCLSGKCTLGLCERADPGGPCRVAGDCTTAACTNGMCENGPLGGKGAACSAGAACLSESCVAGVCGPSASGFACAAGADCASGLSCLNGFCSGGIN